ncbi:MAG: response regulator [Anaerolineales bacterium]|nr:response regulator [Anaerolineales bacterium]
MTSILVVEDERDIRELIGYTLRFAGYDVVLAADGPEALGIVASKHLDLIVLDVRMPKMTGYEVCRLLKESPDTKHIPVVFLSAKGQGSEIEQGLASGAEGYILKPFVPDELTDQLRQVLAQATVTT